MFQACLLKDHDYLQYCKADVLEKKGFPRTQTKLGIRERESDRARETVDTADLHFPTSRSIKALQAAFASEDREIAVLVVIPCHLPSERT